MMNAKQLRMVILIAASIVIVLGLSLYYMYGIQPIKKSITAKKEELKTNQKILETLQVQTHTNQQSEEDLVELQKKIPVEAFTDLLIMELRIREQDTSSVITNYSFATTPTTTTELYQVIGDPEAEAAQGGSAPASSAPAANTEQEQAAGESQAEPSAGGDGSQPSQAAALPALEVIKLGVNLEVEAPSYVKFNSFLKSIEAMERIIKVDSISFDDTKNKYSLSFTTFFVPAFQGIEEQLPPGIFPAPSGKKVPIRSAIPVSNPSEP
ncbi:hypothetical protein [Paenibacillus sp. 1001270B_150601_E10]|uniref:hypothetical protein n=1 Tax=Paenibacillus sp. 1001270B_150601_E10 TaxID=2787079 RepID=UPI00189F5352|nr:hypothetical protein [Paenibacillus sp. 1001270B_150601_E10]